MYVVSGLKSGLLGGIARVALGLLARVHAIYLDSTASVKEQYPKLLKGLDKMVGEYKAELKPDAKPFSLTTPRRIPLHLLPKVKQELSHLEDLGVTSKVEQPTNW